MDREQLVFRVCAWAVIFALALRLFSTLPISDILQQPETISLLFFSQTARRLQWLKDEDPDATVAATEPEPAMPVFSAEDSDLVSLQGYKGYDVDVTSLLLQPLNWDLTEEQPTVLILHSHTTESYENTEGYLPSSSYRTLDEQYNMLSIGDAVAQILESGGVHVIHDRSVHDYPSYNNSYTQARASMEAYLEQYPSIRLVLDLHRDAMEDSEGHQVGTTITLGDKSCARLMLVVGTDASGYSHPDWQENMALAVKLHALLQSRYPGICRDINLRSQRFNQDLSPGALLVEVGAAGNTRQEALTAAECLAQCILALARGTS